MFQLCKRKLLSKIYWANSHDACLKHFVDSSSVLILKTLIEAEKEWEFLKSFKSLQTFFFVNSEWVKSFCCDRSTSNSLDKVGLMRSCPGLKIWKSILQFLSVSARKIKRYLNFSISHFPRKILSVGISLRYTRTRTKLAKKGWVIKNRGGEQVFFVKGDWKIRNGQNINTINCNQQKKWREREKKSVSFWFF